MARGYHDSLTRSLVNAYMDRCETMNKALDQYLPKSSQAPTYGGSSFWVKGNRELDTRLLYKRAAEEGILIEPGDIHFLSDDPPLNYFRLGYSSIINDRIKPGIKRLAEIISEMS